MPYTGKHYVACMITADNQTQTHTNIILLKHFSKKTTEDTGQKSSSILIFMSNGVHTETYLRSYGKLYDSLEH